MQNKILHYRELLQMSQAEVAKKLGIDRNSYARIERGERRKNDTIFNLAMECLAWRAGKKGDKKSKTQFDSTTLIMYTDWTYYGD